MLCSLKTVIKDYDFSRELKKERRQVQEAAPFVQWVGGKRRLIDSYQPFFPEKFNNYFEPFAGGGSLFFHFVNQHGDSKQYTLFDKNQELATTYNQIKEDWRAVQYLLNEMNKKHSKEFYYSVRNIDREKISERRYKKTLSIVKDLDPAEVAARFLYLNITCFNAIYRVNRDGLMNVPVGRTLQKNFGDNGNLKLCSEALKNATVSDKDFSDVEDLVQPGDLVYFDPPYDPISDTSSFTAYTEGGFSFEDQTRLRDLAQRLKDKGVHVYLSNSGSSRIRELYKNWTIKEFSLKRTLNSKAEKRKDDVAELLIF
tara:strand:- start:37 stop:975 length:939 start_codon:yes stop_codon:yes gene_type:complete